MRMNVWMLCLMGCLAVATTAQAQPGGGRGGRGGRGGMGMGGGFGGGSIFTVAGNEAVQKDVGLSSDEIAKVKTITDDYRTAIGDAMREAGGGGNFQDMTQEERAKMNEKMTDARKATSDKFLPKLKAAVTADQFTRLQQIHWQNQGTGALSEPEVVKALPISKDQQDKIKTLTDEYAAKRTELFTGGGGGGPEMFQKMQEINKERDAKINEVLTKDQLDKFAMLKGKEFDVEQLRQFGRGGRGGGGGGNGGGGGGGGGRAKRPQPKAE